MAELLLALVELFFEVLLQIVGEAAVDLFSRIAAAALKPHEPPHQVGTWFACAVLGAFGGAASLAIFPHPLFRSSAIHGISLVVSPTITGAVMWALGALLRRRGKRVVQIETFRYGFAFAIGMALVRFFLAS